MIMANKDNSSREAINNLLGKKLTIQPPTTQKKEKIDEEPVREETTVQRAGRTRNAEPTDTTALRLPIEDLNKLKAISDKENVSLSELIRQSIRRAIDKYEQDNGPVQPVKFTKKSNRPVF